MIDLKKLVKDWADQPDIGKRIVVFGSSNTAFRLDDMGRYNWSCWLTLWIRDQIGKHISLTNAGIGGETVLDLLGRFERDVLPHKPELVIITIGGNDHTYVKLPVYRRELTRLAEEFKSQNTLPVIQTYYSTLDDGDQNGPFDDYMATATEVAESCDIPCIDNFAILRPWHLREPEEYKKLMHDDWHLNSLGHAVFGTLTCRAFGLTDPILPQNIAEDTAVILNRLL